MTADFGDIKTRVLMISKPIEPPWNDGAKNIVHSQLLHASRFRYRVMTSGQNNQFPPLPDHVETDPVYSEAGHFSPSMMQNARVLLHGLKPEGDRIFHYFYAPNPMTSFAGWLQRSVARVKTVHTICSAPASYEGITPMLFADRLITLSEHTRDNLVEAGVEASQIRVVRPAIEPIEPKTIEQRQEIRREYGLEADARIILFPGDYEFSSGARVFAQSIPILTDRLLKSHFIFACRPKTDLAWEVRADIESEIKSAGMLDRVSFIDEVPDMKSLVGACDLVAFPCEDLYAKIDTPLVLLEAMSQRVPVVVASAGPLRELAQTGGVASVPPSTLSDSQRLSSVYWMICPSGIPSVGGRSRLSQSCSHRSEWPGRLKIYMRRSYKMSMLKETRSYYDDFAQGYEKERHHGYHAMLDKLQLEVLRPLAAERDVLEVGCGTGLILEGLSSTANSITGIDLSAGMLRKAVERGFDTYQASAGNLPFQDESFDLVYSVKVLSHIPEIKETLEEMARVLRPGGVMVAEFYNKWSLRYLAKRIGGPGKISETRTEADVYVRWDTPWGIADYLPENVKLERFSGVRVATPFASVCTWPVLRNVLPKAESALKDTPLSLFGGFLMAIGRKQG